MTGAVVAEGRRVKDYRKENTLSQLFSVPCFSISAQLHTYSLCRLIWNKYRKYKMRTYINTLHQTFRYAYPTHVKLSLKQSLENLLLMRSDMRSLICALAAYSVKMSGAGM
jgi:hypothetical protein